MPPLMCANLTESRTALYRWLARQILPEQLTWLDEKLKQVAEGISERRFFTTFSAVSRYLGKQTLALTAADLQDAEAIRSGWFPRGWSVDQAGRSLLLLSLFDENIERGDTLDKLFSTADVSELVALYQSLPLLPDPERQRQRAAEGIRSNMSAVFNAVALQNPYPTDYFDLPAWNQMVLKAIFIGSPLHLIWNLDQRANPDLARMLSDYAHERWAAQRLVMPELWRSVGPFIDDKTIADLKRVFAEPDQAQQAAAALACSQSLYPPAQMLLAQHPEFYTEIRSGQLTWNCLNQKYPSATR